MRQGWDGDMVLSTKGDLMAIATGSDSCTEHECGSEELLRALTGHEAQSATDVAARLKSKALAAIPSIVDRRRIRANLEKLVYEEGEEDGAPVAAFGFAGVDRTLHQGLLRSHELQLVRGKVDAFVGAWDSESFGFKVAGSKNVGRLREFARQVRDGNGVFAGTFMKGTKGMQVRGVCIAVEPLLRTEHRQAMAKAQAEFEATVQLEVLSRAEELREISWKTKAAGRNVVSIWAIWKDRIVGSEVLYCVNPGYRCKGPGGPKTFEELRDWLRGEEAVEGKAAAA